MMKRLTVLQKSLTPALGSARKALAGAARGNRNTQKPLLSVVHGSAQRTFIASDTARSFNPYLAFWMFVVGAIIGYAVETVFILVVTGQYEIRSSLVFGPFNIIYGAGAVVLYAGLSRIDRKNKVQVFVLGALVCTVVELACSFLQEIVFGSTSWDYSWAPFNFDGRVCLLFSFGWGFLALLFAQVLLPACETCFAAVPLYIMRPLTLILLGLLVLDIALSAVAVTRWSMRLEGTPALSFVGGLIDFLFPDEKMGKIYANMQHLR